MDKVDIVKHIIWMSDSKSILLWYGVSLNYQLWVTEMLKDLCRRDRLPELHVLSHWYLVSSYPTVSFKSNQINYDKSNIDNVLKSKDLSMIKNSWCEIIQIYSKEKIIASIDDLLLIQSIDQNYPHWMRDNEIDYDWINDKLKDDVQYWSAFFIEQSLELNDKALCKYVFKYIAPRSIDKHEWPGLYETAIKHKLLPWFCDLILKTGGTVSSEDIIKCVIKFGGLKSIRWCNNSFPECRYASEHINTLIFRRKYKCVKYLINGQFVDLTPLTLPNELNKLKVLMIIAPEIYSPQNIIYRCLTSNTIHVLKWIIENYHIDFDKLVKRLMSHKTVNTVILRYLLEYNMRINDRILSSSWISND